MKQINKLAMSAFFTMIFVAAIGCAGSGSGTNSNGSKTISTDATANKKLLTDFTGTNSVTVSGTWTNNMFATTGNVTTNISLNTTTNIATFVFNIDGNVYGGSDPAPETFTVDMTDFITNGTATLNVTSATYGDISVNLTVYTDGSGTFTGTATNEPTGQVTDASFSGTFNISGSSVTFSIADSSFTYNGVKVTCGNSLTTTLN